jgi:hypothetical protein
VEMMDEVCAELCAIEKTRITCEADERTPAMKLAGCCPYQLY